MSNRINTISFNIDIAPKAHDMGRNLLRGAGLTSLDSITEGGITFYRINSMSASLVKIVDGVDGNKGVWVKTNTGETNVYRGVLFIAAVNKGEQYTLSAWVKGTAGNTLYMEFVNSNGTGRKNSDGTSGTYQLVVFNLTDGWQRVSHTFTVDSKNAGYVECNFFTNVVGEFTVSEPKLERGDTATAFCLNEDDLKGDKGTDAISYSIELDPNFNSSATLTNSGATVTVLVAGKFNLYSLTGTKKSLYSGTAHYALSCAGVISEGEVTGGIGTPNYSKDFDSKNQSAIPSSAVLTVYKDSTKTSALAVQIIPISINAGAIAEFDQKLGQYSIMVASQRTGQNMWVNGDFSLPDTLAPAFSHIIGPNASTSHVERIDGVDLPDGFLHRLVFNVPVANGGICYKGTQPHISTSTIAETGTNGLVTKNDYVLSLYAKATASCDMAIGLENVLTKTVNLTGQWQRFSVHIPKGTDLSKWTTAVIFYPTTAIGTDKYVCITGIQFETGSTPQTWSKSDFDMEVAGLRIGNGGIEAIAGKFDFIGKNGKPYIKAELDDEGMPHLIFYNKAGTAMYDLGYTGLFNLIQDSDKQSWVNYTGQIIDGDTAQCASLTGGNYRFVDNDIVSPSVLERTVYEYHPASLQTNGKKTYYNSDCKNQLYLSTDVDESLNNKPTGTTLYTDNGTLQLNGYLYELVERKVVSKTVQNGTTTIEEHFRFSAHAIIRNRLNLFDGMSDYNDSKTVKIKKLGTAISGSIETKYQVSIDGSDYEDKDVVKLSV